MKKTYPLSFSLACLCLIASLDAPAQELVKTLGYTKDGKSDARPKPFLKAYFIKYGDSTFEKLLYRNNGVCQVHETFADSGYTTLHGIFVSYTNIGWVNEMGYYTNGQRSGMWYRRIGTFQYAVEIQKEGTVTAIDTIFINPTVKNQAYLRKSDKTRITDANFPGGPALYQKYLKDKLVQSKFFREDSHFEALVAFFIQPSGLAGPAIAWQSKRFETDMFARKIMYDMPAWTPARDESIGKNVAILYFQRLAIYEQ
jgi:hypothetical protein